MSILSLVRTLLETSAFHKAHVCHITHTAMQKRKPARSMTRNLSGTRGFTATPNDVPSKHAGTATRQESQQIRR